MRAKADAPPVNEDAPAHGRKVVLYATCFVNYNNPDIGLATQKVLAHNGVETEVVYPECCGMPMLELGDLVRHVLEREVLELRVAPAALDVDRVAEGRPETELQLDVLAHAADVQHAVDLLVGVLRLKMRVIFSFSEFRWRIWTCREYLRF